MFAISQRICPGAALLLALCALSSPAAEFTVTPSAGRLTILYEGQPVGIFVFQDDKILRPYFANLHAPGRLQVTRNHPPVAGQDATDHDTMHPGLWLGFGDLNGQDFWRNQGRIEHVRFLGTPKSAAGRLTFATESRLLGANRSPVCALTNRFTLGQLPNAWLLVWDATFSADAGDLVFGDQEEMGFGVRLATAITEKNGGTLTSSTGRKTAKDTWGQSADWCDYSATLEGLRVGILLMPDPANFRPSWWHNRDYGLMVANPFGREAMKQGTKCSTTIKAGESLRLRFGAVIHGSGQGAPIEPATYASMVLREFGASR